MPSVYLEFSGYLASVGNAYTMTGEAVLPTCTDQPDLPFVCWHLPILERLPFSALDSD
jgi:hypothetical protein